MDDMDFDVEHYTNEELLALLSLQGAPEASEIKAAVDHLVHKYNERDPDRAAFFTEVYQKLAKPATPAVYSVEVKRGDLNPETRSTVTRMVNVDSFYRRSLEKDNANTDSVFVELNEKLHGVLSLTLYSLEVPLSWYAYSAAKGNTGVVVWDSDNVGTEVAIHDGNYTQAALLDALVAAVNAKLPALNLTASLDCSCRKVTLTTTAIVTLQWFDDNFANPVLANAAVNSNLGWVFGFRYPTTLVTPAGVEAPAVFGTAATKYLILQVEDFRGNRLTKGLVAVKTVANNAVRLPFYAGLASKTKFGAKSAEFTAMPTTPRALTSAQLFTLNAVTTANSGAATRARLQNPDNSDIFAKIPLKNEVDWTDGQAKIFVEFSGPLQSNVREYFGPVSIATLRLSLFDDHGRPLGLNGQDWSCTFLAKCFYQY
jgi:hypothetical protein